MRKIKLIGAILAMLTGMLVLTAPTAAHAATAESVYTTSEIQRCLFGIVLCVDLQAYSTYSSSQIWINGKVSCTGYGANVTWCGVGGGNGTATLNIGMDWNWPGIANNLYERMNIKANHGGCQPWGSSSPVHGYSWFTGYYACESAA